MQKLHVPYKDVLYNHVLYQDARGDKYLLGLFYSI